VAETGALESGTDRLEQVMVFTISYKIKSGEVRRKSFIRDCTAAEMKKFFAWRYGHPILVMRISRP
jgi:hypothetical protein